MKKKTQWHNNAETPGEENNMPSLTIPDQTMSMQTILLRYAQNLDTVNPKEGHYQEGDEYSDLPDLRTLDLVDRQLLSEQFKEELKNLSQKLNPQNQRPRVEENDSVRNSAQTSKESENLPIS